MKRISDFFAALFYGSAGMFGICAGLAIIVAGVGLFVGWFRNIWYLIAEPASLFTLLRLLGIPFAPLGGLLGWF